MTEPSFNARGYDPTFTRRNMPNQVQKFIDGEWVKMSDWPAIDEERLQRHARALGGSVRLMRGDLLLREWRNGQEVEPA